MAAIGRTPKLENAVSSKLTSRKDNDINCLVAKGTKIEGNFSSTENIRLDGSIKGELTCKKKLVMGPDGFVEGKIFTGEAVIMGTVKGSIKVEGTLHLLSTSSVQGNITANYIMVEEGARFSGKCKVGD